MEKEQLKQTLASLHAELARRGELDGDVRDLLRQLAGDIDDVLDSGEPRASALRETEHSSLIDRLRDARSRFEETHPDLAMTLGRVADALSQLGI